MGNQKYLITGATGVIGSALVKHLSSEGHYICCPVRNLQKVKNLFGDIESNNIKFVETDLTEYLRNIDENFDYIIHCASPTASKFFVESPVETIMFGLDSTSALLNYSRNHDIKSFVFLSSLEIYGTITDDTLPVSEDMQGYVNPLDVRSSYNMVKRMCETLCHAYYKEYKIPAKIVRLTQVIPSTASSSDLRVFAQFARKAIAGEDIELHTDGLSARPYIQIEDAVNAILTVLYKGKNGEAYNACNEDTYISARDMAEFVQKNFNLGGKIIYNLRDDMGYAPNTKIRLDSSKLNQLGWQPKYNLYDMFNQLISSKKI